MQRSTPPRSPSHPQRQRRSRHAIAPRPGRRWTVERVPCKGGGWVDAGWRPLRSPWGFSMQKHDAHPHVFTRACELLLARTDFLLPSKTVSSGLVRCWIMFVEPQFNIPDQVISGFSSRPINGKGFWHWCGKRYIGTQIVSKTLFITRFDQVLQRGAWRSSPRL